MYRKHAKNKSLTNLTTRRRYGCILEKKKLQLYQQSEIAYYHNINKLLSLKNFKAVYGSYIIHKKVVRKNKNEHLCNKSR